MKYGQAITAACVKYAQQHSSTRYIGYNTVKGSRMYGTLCDVADTQCIETPICENLMVGMAAGLALQGYRPVVCFERHDFLLLGLDALVNHIDKLPRISGYQFKLPVMIRAIVGASSPLNAGEQHTMDYTQELESMLKYTEVCKVDSVSALNRAWSSVGRTESGAVVVVEYKDRYDQEIS